MLVANAKPIVVVVVISVVTNNAKLIVVVVILVVSDYWHPSTLRAGPGGLCCPRGESWGSEIVESEPNW